MTDTLTAPLLATAPVGEQRRSLWAWLTGQGHGKRRAMTQEEAAAEVKRLEAVVESLTHDLTQVTIQASGQADMQQAAAVNANLRAHLDNLHGHLRFTVGTLGDPAVELLAERDAHAATLAKLDTAVRANRANAGAVTVTTDISSLGLPQADVFEDLSPRGPEFPPHRRALPPWDSPLATAGVTR